VKRHAFGFLEDMVKGMLDFGRSLAGMSEFPGWVPCFVHSYSLILFGFM
jgi:hypothetical protein